MKLPSFFKRARKTRSPGFRNYRLSSGQQRRKPFVPKMNASPTPTPDRLTRKHAGKKARFVLVLKGLTGVAALSAAVYVLFFTPLLQIEKIEIKGDSETLEEEAALNSYLMNYFGDNLLMFPTTKHETTLLAEFPYLKTLQIHRKFPDTLNVVIRPHPRAANITIQHEDETRDFFIVNDLGSIAATGVSDETLPTIVMDVTGTDQTLEVNSNVIPQDTLNTLLDINKNFEAKFKMNILQTEYLKRAKEVHLYTEREFYVWIDLTQPIDEQLTKLKKALTKLNLYEEPLDYIDLRISGQSGEKVIYKLK